MLSALLHGEDQTHSIAFFVFLASPDALEVIVVTDLLTYSLTQSALVLTWLMWPWWVMIHIEDLTDVALAIEDTDEDDIEDLTDITPINGWRR